MIRIFRFVAEVYTWAVRRALISFVRYAGSGTSLNAYHRYSQNLIPWLQPLNAATW